VENVKSLKHDFSPFGGSTSGLFQYQSISQKILRKSLSNGANKMLDRFNDRLVKILNSGSGLKIKQVEKKERKKRIKSENDEDKDEEDEDDEDNDDYEDEDMEDE